MHSSLQQWSAGDVIVDGVRLHYTRTGGAKPALVLAHGFSDDGLCWSVVAQHLEEQFDIVMVDARGHGLSEAPADDYSADRLAHDLAGVIMALKLDSPVIMGHSMGAATAMTLAGLYPHLPRALVLEDPPAWWKVAGQPAPIDSPNREEWRQKTRDWITGMKSQSRDELIQNQKKAAPSWSDAEIELWADAHQRLSPNVVNGRGVRGQRDLDLLQSVTCPVLLVTAEPDRGAIVRESDAVLLKDILPQLQVAHIAGAGHSIHREGFAKFMSAVQTFLQSVV